MKCHPNGAGTLSPGKSKIKNKITPVPDWLGSSGKTVVVPVEFSPAAHAILLGLALNDGLGSVGQYLRSLCVQELRSMGKVFHDDENPYVEELLAMPTGGAR